jgi:hypothetical protein
VNGDRELDDRREKHQGGDDLAHVTPDRSLLASVFHEVG